MSFHLALAAAPASNHGEAISQTPKRTLTKRAARPTSASAITASVTISAPMRWSLWAAVPHYVSLTPSPRAAKALVDRLAELLNADVDTTELDEAADAYAQQVSEAVATDADTASYVEELERRVDEIAEEAEIPSGDAIAAELTRYLRERDNDDEGGDDVAREQ